MERSINSGSPGSWLLYAVWLLAGGSFALAEPVDLDEAQRLFLSGNYKECIKAAEERPVGRRSEPWQLLLSRSLMATGQLPEGLQAITNALTRDRWNVRLLWEAREVLLSNGRPEEADKMVQDLLEEVSNRPRDYRDALSLVAFSKAALFRGADAKRVLTTVLDSARKANPKEREVYLTTGRLALEKKDFSLASKTFEAGLKELPDDPDLYYGMACAFADSDIEVMKASLESALSRNTNHVESLLLLVDHTIDAEEYSNAERILDRIQGINPAQTDSWAYRAVIAHLRNQPAEEKQARREGLKYWASNPRVDHLIGRKLSQNYRFKEGAAYQRTALRLAPDYLPAKAQLAEDLLRLGDETEGWKLVQQVHESDGYDVEAYNLATLHDTMGSFATVTNSDFQVRMSATEARIYGERALSLLGRARSNLTEKYGISLSQPVLVEIFPEQKDFAVRTFGMPGNPGYLGVCFGSVITANSPAAQKGQAVNWEAVLWHEFCHVVTLHMTHNKMPRWLSEGISVYEETCANPAWGQRMTPRYREMILGKEFTPISELSSAFLSPPSPMHLQFAYYESNLAVEFLISRFGAEALKAILRDLGEGHEINEAIAKHTGSMNQLEAQFASFARDRALQMAPGLDWEKPGAKKDSGDPEMTVELPKRSRNRTPDVDEAEWTKWAEQRPTNFWVMTRQVEEAVRRQDWETAKPILEKLVDLYPDCIGSDSPYPLLARVLRAEGATNAEMAVLSELARRDAAAPDAYARLMEHSRAGGDWEGVRLNAERYLAVNPLIPIPHKFLAEASENLGELPAAIQAYRALLELGPEDPAETHYRLARALFKSGKPEAKRHVLQALEEAPRFRAALKLLLEIERKTTESTMNTAPGVSEAP